MLNSGLGFSDEFEMEACSYSAKSSSKFMQQYREWTYAMRKESSAFFRSVKDKVHRSFPIFFSIFPDFTFDSAYIKSKYHFVFVIAFNSRPIQQ